MELKLFSNIILNFGHQIRIRERFISVHNIELEGITIYFTINNLSFMKYEIKRIFPFPAIKQKTIHLYNLNKLSRSKKIGFFYDKLSAKTKEVLYR